MVDGSQKHSGDSDNSFLVSAPFSEREIAVSDFRVFLGFGNGDGTLDKQRLDVSSAMADSCSLFLPGTFIVLRGKARPRTQVLIRWKHGHINTDFRDNRSSSENVTDTGNSRNQLKLRQVFLRNAKMTDSRLSLQSSRLPMWERMIFSFSACSSQIAPSIAA